MNDTTGDRIYEIIKTLRLEKSDNRQYEAKAAAKGFPDNALRSISAFANTPGGGVLLFGVAEEQDFFIVGVYDSKNCQQTLANYANKEFSSPVTIISDLVIIEEKPVVVAKVLEADKTIKPIKVRKTGKSYIRLYDSDFELSELEEQRFIAGRGVSRFDEVPVRGSGLKDLNKELLEAYISNRRRSSAVVAKMTQEEMLFRTGITTESGELTTAGLFTLGIYPQQYFPNYSIQASVRNSSKYSSAVRAVNVKTFDGPISEMLKNSIEWVDHNSDDMIMDLEGWQVGEVKEFPLMAVRELVANALIHRDLNPVSMTQNISLTIENGQLSISNPGGLFGISVRELGRSASRTRNTRLADICQYVPAERGANIIEKLGSGIPKVFAEQDRYKFRRPQFIDGEIYFTTVLYKGYPGRKQPGVPPRNRNATLVLNALSDIALSRVEIEKRTMLTTAQVRYALSKLMEKGLVTRIGDERDPKSTYMANIED